MANNEDLQCQEGQPIIDENQEFEFETVPADNEEMYTVDFNPEQPHVIFGGKNDMAEIYDFKEDLTVTRVEEFSDSIIYSKFISKDRFILVSANGTIALMEYEKDISIVDLEEDLSTAVFSDDKLVVGAVSGQVYLYDADLEHINTFGGHYSEIISVDFKEDRVLSLCSSFLTAHDVYGRCLYSLKATEATAFKYLASDVVCFAREKKIQLFKETKKLFELKTEDNVETIELVEKSLVMGGFFDFIQLVDTTGHFATFKLQINACASLIKKYRDFQIIFATLDGFIGLLDIRNINTLKMFAPEVGTIFDFAIGPNKVAVVGETGFGMVDLENDTPIEMSQN